MTWLFAFLLKRCSGSKWAATLILLAIVAAVVAMLCAAAYSRGYRAADQKALVKQLKEQNSTLSRELKNANGKLDQLEALQRENQALADVLTAQKRASENRYRTLRTRAPAAAQTVVAASPDGEPARCIFPAEFVRLWNDALSVPDAAGGISGAAEAAGAADEVTADDVLTNHIDNAEISRDTFDQCSALIEWHREHDR